MRYKLHRNLTADTGNTVLERRKQVVNVDDLMTELLGTKELYRLREGIVDIALEQIRRDMGSIYIDDMLRVACIDIKYETAKIVRDKLIPVIESKICSMIEKVER